MKTIIQNKNIYNIKRTFYSQVYKKCFKNAKKEIHISKILFYGVRYIRYFDFKNASYNDILEALKIIDFINNLISRMSFYSLINIFPITKEYNGKKFECKDYFSTIEYLQDKQLDKLIGEYSLDDFLCNYYNLDIIYYNVNCFMIYDRFAKLNGQKTLMELFSEQFNIPTYLKVDENTMINKNTLEIFKINNNKKGDNNEY